MCLGAYGWTICLQAAGPLCSYLIGSSFHKQHTCRSREPIGSACRLILFSAHKALHCCHNTLFTFHSRQKRKLVALFSFFPSPLSKVFDTCSVPFRPQATTKFLRSAVFVFHKACHFHTLLRFIIYLSCSRIYLDKCSNLGNLLLATISQTALILKG